MWTECKVFKNDLAYITNVDYIRWEKLMNKVVLVTGGTGLLGYYFINALLYKNLIDKYNIKILAIVRDLKKANKLFFEVPADIKKNLIFIKGDIEHLECIDGRIDYIFHAASPTSSDFFINQPVETIKTSVIGTINVFELALKKNICGVLYLSSMEIYGQHNQETLLHEDEVVNLKPFNLRDCYPITKCMNENLALSYSKEYSLPVNSVRLSQVIGTLVPPLESTDSRLIIELAKNVILQKDMVLKTRGESRRTYVYIADAITAALAIMTSNSTGEVYNVSDENTYCSVYELCENVINYFSNEKIKVKIQERDTNKYPDTNYLKLDSSKLRNLGWKPSKNIVEMFKCLISM